MKGLSRSTHGLQESIEKRNKMNKYIKILLIDDRELVRYRLRRMLEPEEDMEVVGDYSSAEEGLSEIARLHPDIVLVDAQMKGVDWIEATRSLKRNECYPDTEIIILADSMERRVEALEAGAAGYLVKGVTHVELAQTIRKVYQNRHLPEAHEGFAEDEVELVVSPPANAARLLKFMCHLEEMLQDSSDNYAGIVHMVGSWDWGTVITILVKPAALSSVLDRLGNMPEVGKLEEESPAEGAFSSLPRRFGILPRSGIRPSKRVRVTLGEAGMVGRELPAVLNW